MHSVWFGEFLGTLVLVLLGNGVCANVTLRKSYAADAGWMVITTGWAMGVLCGVLVAQAFGSSGANLNPAITLAVAVTSGDYSQLAWLWSAQLLGAMGGAALVAMHFALHWKPTPDPAAKLGVFCTNGAVRNTPINILNEALGTAVLVVVAFALGSRGVAPNGMGAGQLGTLSTRRATWVRGWFIGCCRFRERADRTGAMRWFRLWDRCLAEGWRGC